MPGTNGQAAAAKKDSETPSSPLRRSEQVLRLIVTPPALFQAHADLRAAADAVRTGLIGHATGLRLARRAQERVRCAETGLPLPGRDRPPVAAEPLEFRRPVRRGEAVPLDLFLQRRWEKAARREDERTQRRLLPLIRAARNEALARGRAP